MKKILTLFVILSLFSFSFVVAQTNLNVGVVVGDTIKSDMTTEDVQASSVLGGIVSAISHYYERYVDFSGLKIWVDSETSSPEFTLMMWPAGSAIGEVVVGDLFESSEEIVLPGRTTTPHVWDTYSATSGGIVDGYLVSGFEGSSLAILPEGIYDIYGEVI